MRYISSHPAVCYFTSLQRLLSERVFACLSVENKKGEHHFFFNVSHCVALLPQYIQCFINSSWYDRYEEPPPPQTITMIWSLIVSMYAVGGLFGAISVKFVSGRLGR